VPAPPYRHLGVMVACALVPAFDLLVNGAGVERAVIVLRHQRQIGWLAIELGAEGPEPFPSAASSAIQ